MTTFLPAEKGMTIRQPSTANLMLDSADRNLNVDPLANSFQITRPQAILNGFFTRIATSEVVLEWNTANIGGLFDNDVLTVDLSGGGTTTGTATINALAPPGFYNQAQIIDWVVLQLNDVSGSFTPNVTWSVNSTTTGVFALVPSADIYVEFSGSLATLIGWANGALVEYGTSGGGIPRGFIIPTADLRPVRYLDFVSPQLTYNQDLKDSTTATFVRDVLCRWYFAYDQPPELDKYGFPILMGYTPFTLRRTFSPPKQIRWDNIQPVGNIAFQVYDNNNALATMSYNTQWLMTLQISEC